MIQNRNRLGMLLKYDPNIRHLVLRAMKPDKKLNKNNMYLNIENDCVEKGRDELFPSQILKTF